MKFHLHFQRTLKSFEMQTSHVRNWAAIDKPRNTSGEFKTRHANTALEFPKDSTHRLRPLQLENVPESLISLFRRKLERTLQANRYFITSIRKSMRFAKVNYKES